MSADGRAAYDDASDIISGAEFFAAARAYLSAT
jgi:hypothetical protein